MDPMERLEKKYGPKKPSFFNARNILFFTSLSVILITLGIIQTLLFEAMSFFSQVADARGWFTFDVDPAGLSSTGGASSLSCSWLLLENTSSSSSETGLSEHQRTSCFHQNQSTKPLFSRLF